MAKGSFQMKRILTGALATVACAAALTGCTADDTNTRSAEPDKAEKPDYDTTVTTVLNAFESMNSSVDEGASANPTNAAEATQALFGDDNRFTVTEYGMKDGTICITSTLGVASSTVLLANGDDFGLAFTAGDDCAATVEEADVVISHAAGEDTGAVVAKGVDLLGPKWKELVSEGRARTFEMAAENDAKMVALTLEAQAVDTGTYPADLAGVLTAVQRDGLHLSDGITIAAYAAAGTDLMTGSFELCLVHSATGAWALLESETSTTSGGTSGGVQACGIGTDPAP